MVTSGDLGGRCTYSKQKNSPSTLWATEGDVCVQPLTIKPNSPCTTLFWILVYRKKSPCNLQEPNAVPNPGEDHKCLGRVRMLTSENHLKGKRNQRPGDEKAYWNPRESQWDRMAVRLWGMGYPSQIVSLPVIPGGPPTHKYINDQH